MKNIIASKICLAGAVLGLAFTAGTISAQTTLIGTNVNNGGFESTTAKVDFGTPTSGTGTVPYWGSLGNVNDSDSGVQVGGNVVHSGAAGAFFKPGEGAFNLASGYSIANGDVFTLTFWAYDSNPTAGGESATVTLFSQASPGPNYTYNPSATLASSTFVFGNTGFAQYSLSFTETGADVGQDIGISFNNLNVAGHYISADDFNLTVTSVPEPSTYTLLSAGVVGLLALRRLRRASV